MRIYKITNTVNGKVYVGQTVQTLERRWALHKHQAKHRNRPLYRSIRKYGIQHFVVELLEELSPGSSQQILDEKERFWIAHLNAMVPSGYNLTSGGDGKSFLSEETKARISQAKLGKSRSPETVEAMRLGAMGNTHKRGKKLSDASKARISASQLGRKNSEETKARKADAHRGEKAYNAKKVQCLETGMIYPSTGEAARQTGLQQSSISAVCLGKRKSTGGLCFRFVTDKAPEIV